MLRYKWSREGIGNEPHSLRLKPSTTEKNADQVNEFTGKILIISIGSVPRPIVLYKIMLWLLWLLTDQCKNDYRALISFWWYMKKRENFKLNRQYWWNLGALFCSRNQKCINAAVSTFVSNTKEKQVFCFRDFNPLTV